MFASLALLGAEVSAAVEPVAATGAASWAWLMIAVPLASFAVLILAGRRSDRWGHLLATCASWFSFIVGAVIVAQMLGADEASRRMTSTLFSWIPAGDFRIDFGTLVDPLSMTFVVLVTFVGSLIHVYAIAYMEHDADRRRFFAYLNLFIAAMLTLVLADSYAVLFVGWEGVGLASYLLISFWNHVPAYATAGKKAFVMNRVGDLGMLIAMMAMVATFESVKFTDVAAGVAQVSEGTASLIGVFLLLAACGKSAQFPLQAWLGDAMAGPTPVSALIHAATMVTAGVYLMVRSGAIYQVAPTATLLVALVGLVTLVFGAVVGAAKDDMKKVLAASTMSQIGYMMLAAGLGPIGAGFAIFHLVTHGFFKANMFLGAGAVMHAMNDEVNIRGFGGLAKHMKITFYTFFAGYLAIIGFPFLSGFFSKDKIIEAAFTGQGALPWIFGTITVLVAGLTAFYMSRLFFAIFLGEERWERHGTNAKHPHDPSPFMWLPMAILALGSVLLGAILNYTGFLTWLEPAIGHAPHADPVLPVPVITGTTLAVVALGVALAWRIYVAKPMPKAAPVGNSLVHAARSDLFQDEINEGLFMKPGIALMAGTEVLDRSVVDGAVNGIGKATPALGSILSRFQTGYARNYASYVTIGLTLALIVVVASL